MQDSPEVPLAAKIEYLRQPGSYPDGAGLIETIETHFAWVFLSRRFVYKLKKPIRFQGMDFTSLQTRRVNCELEVALNRRLAEAVYVGVVPLSVTDSGMALEGTGPPIEWLVKMHRLPANRVLDEAARNAEVTAADLRAVITKLVRFYASTTRAFWSEAEYLEHLEKELRDYRRRLSTPQLRLDPRTVEPLIAAQQGFLRDRADLPSARITQGWVVDAHGDLRPEHIFLTEIPQIIDCLEFSTELRLLDSAAELAFLALECERMGQRSIGEQMVHLYLEQSRDPIPPELLHFYRSMRALVRALLSAWHLVDADTVDAERWLRRANWYLDAARTSIEEALAQRR